MMFGGGVTAGSRSGLSNGGAAPDIVSGSNAAATYEVDRSRSVDFAQQTGTSAAAGTTADASSGLGYVTVTPLPATLYTESQSGTDVAWTTYSVTVTINGTNFSVSFTPNDTKAVVIENVPIGASLSASAAIGVPENLGYPGNSLTAATLSPAAIQSGSNSITMWVQYPLECQVAPAYTAQASITGSVPSYYTNAGSTALPAATPSFTDAGGAKMYFTGWALSPEATAPDIPGTSIPAGTYKGKLLLYAIYSEYAVSITGSALPASGDPILTEGDTLALTAVPAGFPSAPAYTWSIESPAADAPVTVSASGVVSTVPGKSGSATIKVTATCGALTATATQDVTVAALKITGSKIFTKGATGKTLPAEFEGFATAPSVTSWTWSSGTATVATAGGSTGTASLGLLAGGKTTVSVDAVVGGKTLHAEKDIYVLDLVVTVPAGTETDGSGNPKLALGNTLDLSASLDGLTAADLAEIGTVTYGWSSGTPAKATVTPDDETPTTATVSPIEAAPSGVVIRAMVSFTGGTLATDTTVVIPESLPIANLADYLKNLPANTPDTAYVIPQITGLTKDNWTQIKDALTASTSAGRYVDLSATTLPSDITTLYQGFYNCTTLVKSPQLPASMTGGSMENCFYGCTNLTTAPAVPAGITTMKNSFFDCRKLADFSALTIPNTVTDMYGCFYRCYELVTAPAIPDGVTNMEGCFYGCIRLTAAPALPGELLNRGACFRYCISLTSFPTIPSKVKDMTTAFGGLSGMSGSITIPSTVVYMDYCFSNTTGTFDVYIYATGCDRWTYLVGEESYEGSKDTITFHVPAGSSLKTRILNGSNNSDLNIVEDL
ncbi:MAG: leucine-rich repeat protein [Treponema sp.]|nr:leucine-rich repeat protein [Treponema sp.]